MDGISLFQVDSSADGGNFSIQVELSTVVALVGPSCFY